MSNIKEVFYKAKSFIEWIFGTLVLVATITYYITNYSTDFEKDRLKLAKEILEKVIVIGMEEDGEEVSNDIVDAIMAIAKNKNKAECQNSIIYYAFSIDSEVIWIKTEKNSDVISAEMATEDIPSTCTLYEKIDNKWKKLKQIPNTEKKSTTKNNPIYSSCDGSIINLSADTGCRYGNDTIKVEIQSEKTSSTQSLYSQRFCVKGNVLTLLMGTEENFENNETAFHSLPQVHPQNIQCPKLIEWLDNYGGMIMGIDDDEEPLFLGGRIG